jgi:hypothetical protein
MSEWRYRIPWIGYSPQAVHSKSSLLTGEESLDLEVDLDLEVNLDWTSDDEPESGVFHDIVLILVG